MSLRIGIDLGGTKIEGIALSGSAERARLRVPTPRHDYAATLDAIVAAVAELERQAGGQGTVGVGIPGTLSATTGLVKNANSTWLIGRPLSVDLHGRLGREVRVANDANCFAMSEAADGAGAGADVVFGVIVGTGTGAGVVSGRRLLTGPNGVAGEWGHNPLPWPERADEPAPGCYCGKRGCIETYLSGPALERQYETLAGRRASAADIVEALGAAAEPGRAAADTVLGLYEQRMARALASVINVLDPDVIVLGGGLSNIERLYENVPGLWATYVFGAAAGEEPVLTRLVRAAHGDASGVRGAAWLW